jgi:hypothetical protein
VDASSGTATNATLIGGSTIDGLSFAGSLVGGRYQTVIAPTNTANLFRIDLEPGAEETGMFIGRPDATIPAAAGGSYMVFVKAPASGTYNHAMGLEAGKADGEVLHCYNHLDQHVGRFNTKQIGTGGSATHELEVRWGRPDGQDQLYWLGGPDPYLTIGTGGLARAGSSRVTVDGTITATAFDGSGAALTDVPITGVTGIPGPGCTVLEGVTPTISGATASYLFAPTNAYTLAVSSSAPRYTYNVEVFGTNAVTWAEGISLVGSWTPAATNLVVLSPSTGTVWRAYGRAY